MRESTESKIAAAKNALAAGLQALVTSDDWTAILRAMAQRGRLSVGRLSFRNQILVMVQAGPEAAQVATYPTWQRMRRQVRAGEKAIWILQPRVYRRTVERNNDEPETVTGLAFRPLAVFALSQTDGEPLPESPVPAVTAPEIFEGSVERLRAVALSLEGSPVAAVTLRPREAGDLPGCAGWYVPATREIVVLEGERSRAHMFKTLVHEVAHALLHGAGERHARPVEEVEAESTAYVVCHALGLDTAGFSLPYVATWADDKDPAAAVLRSGDRIARAAGRILEALGVGAEEAEEGRAAA